VFVDPRRRKGDAVRGLADAIYPPGPEVHFGGFIRGSVLNYNDSTVNCYAVPDSIAFYL